MTIADLGYIPVSPHGLFASIRTFQLHVFGFLIFLLMSVPNEDYSKICIMCTNFDIYFLFIIETPFSNRDQEF